MCDQVRECHARRKWRTVPKGRSNRGKGRSIVQQLLCKNTPPAYVQHSCNNVYSVCLIRKRCRLQDLAQTWYFRQTSFPFKAFEQGRGLFTRCINSTPDLHQCHGSLIKAKQVKPIANRHCHRVSRRHPHTQRDTSTHTCRQI